MLDDATPQVKPVGFLDQESSKYVRRQHALGPVSHTSEQHYCGHFIHKTSNMLRLHQQWAAIGTPLPFILSSDSRLTNVDEKFAFFLFF
jgi:hypothetical protein